MTAPADPALAPGAVLLGRYRLMAPLGEGFGGETWRAQPLTGGPPVAIKMVRNSQGDQHRADLLREASFLRELKHPHVVEYGGVIDLPGTDTTFLITSLAEDGSLEDYVTLVGPRTPTQAAWLLLQLVSGLEAVHAGGVLHRDLKPANVLVRNAVGGAPHLLLADFGISRRTIGNSASLTRPMGSLGYAAPEIWTDGVVTHAADVHGLGAIAWYLLTARHPVPKVGTTLADPAQLDAEVGPSPPPPVSALVALVRQMMRLDPAARPTLGKVRESLLKIYESAPQPPTNNQPWRKLPGEALGAIATTDGQTLVAQEPPKRAGRRALAAGLLAVGSVSVLGAIALMAVAVWVGKDSLEAAGGPDAAQGAGTPEVVGAAAVAPIPAPSAEPDEISVEPAPTQPSPEPTVASVPGVPMVPTGAPEPTAMSAPPELVQAPAVAPRPAKEPPAGVSPGAVGKLGIGLVVQTGFPADATLKVTAPDGTTRQVSSTQVHLSGGPAGMYTVEVWTPTRLLGRVRLPIAAADEVRVRCAVPGGDFGAMACDIR